MFITKDKARELSPNLCITRGGSAGIDRFLWTSSLIGCQCSLSDSKNNMPSVIDSGCHRPDF